MNPLPQPDDLPFLTDIVTPPPAGELPMLTEVVGQPDRALDDLPVLEIVAADDPPPLPEPLPEPEPLTAQSPATIAPAALAAVHKAAEENALDGEDISYLLAHIEEHLSSVFTAKLNSQLEQLQKLAVELAVSEFKAELPQLLRDALEHHRRK